MIIHSKENKIGKWSYKDYRISLFRSRGGLFLAKVKNAEGSILVSSIFFGILGDRHPGDLSWISASKDTLAVFPYLKERKVPEIWVFEAISSAAPYFYRARKTLRKEASKEPSNFYRVRKTLRKEPSKEFSEEGYTKALRYLEIALKIQKYNKGKTRDLEKAILETKKEFFLFQIKRYTKYLSSEEEMIKFRTIVKNGTHYENIFEQFLELVKVLENEEPSSYKYLLKALSYEFLDQPFLAAENYAYLAEKVSNSLHCARNCIEKALSFFNKKDISYAYFLEQLNEEILIQLDLRGLLFEKDVIRMSFEKALNTLAKQSQQTNIPSCFICCNPKEFEVRSWVHHILVSDLKKMHIRPISLENLTFGQDYNGFQKNISQADRVIIVCTPDLKKNCIQQPLIGVAQEIRLAEDRYWKGKGETISLLYLKGDRQSSCPSCFFEPIFAGQYNNPVEKNAFNYYDMIFELVAPMKCISSEIALEIKELFLKEVQKVLNNEIDQHELEEWRKGKIDKKITLSTIKNVQEIYDKIEITPSSEQGVEASLRKHYISKEYITLLISQKQISIEKIYTCLAIIGEREREEKKEKVQEEKPGQSLEDSRPPTHESIFEPKEAIVLEKLFDHDLLKGKKKRIWIQGSAGIGKSTLCHHIAYRWAQKELFQEFDYLFWLPLRRLNTNIYSKKDKYEEYIAKECGLDNPQAFFSKTELREKTLIVLDGYDELSSDTNINGCFHPILMELKKFPHVIITSRPQMIDFTRNCELEILGFGNQGVKEYVNRFFSKDQQEEAKKLQIHLQDPLIGSLAHIPINLEIFCSLSAADESLFTSSESPTMTTIYIGLTDWLFKRFRIERNHEKIATVFEESDAHEAYDVEPLVEVLKELAWEAMEKNTLYLPADHITNICRSVGKERKLKLDLESIRRLGPFRIENGQGVFIHLTFQEYFAAVYLAHSYEKKPKKAKKLLEKIKFEPRYRLVLSMTAGFLSEKAKSKVLSAFFEDLFSEPLDLAISYEICLFAQCFEECLYPEKISYYKPFLKTTADYIKKVPLQTMNIQILNHNRKLFHHPLVVETISEKLRAKTGQKEVIDLLGILAQQKNSLPNDIRDMLYWLMGEKSLQKNILHALGKIVLSGQIGAQKAQSTLVNAVSDFSLDSSVQKVAVNALGMIAESGELVTEEAQSALVKVVWDSYLDEDIRNSALDALGSIAQSEQAGAQKAQSMLMEAISDYSLHLYVLSRAVDALERIVVSGKIGAEKALRARKIITWMIGLARKLSRLNDRK